MALLDTTALVDLTRAPAHPACQAVVTATRRLIQNGETLYTSRLNEAEFRVGGYRAANPARETAKIVAVLAALVILELDAPAAVRYAQIAAHLQSVGRPPNGRVDPFIAAVALVNGQSVVTRNTAHFVIVPGLAVVTY